MSVNNKVMDKLGGLGFTGSANDRMQAHLKGLTGEGNINYALSKVGGFNNYLKENFLSPSFVARLDGATQSWELSAPIELTPNDIVEFDFVGGAVLNSFAAFIGTDNFAVRFDVDSTKSFLREQGLSATLNGQAVASGATPVPSSGKNNVSITVTSSGQLNSLSAISSDRFMNLPLYNFRVIRSGTVIHEILLTNKEQGATQLATVGSVNATMVGYSPDVWEEN